MKALIQTGSSGRVPVPPEKRFLINNLRTTSIIEDLNYKWDPNRFRAHFDEDKVLVYQATNNKNADSALTYNNFDHCFNFNRPTWLKMSYFWMMHRSKWALEEGQERILGVYIRRDFFDQILRQAIAFQPLPKIYAPRGFWHTNWNDEKLRQRLAKESEVVIQLDPERDYLDFKRNRRAPQLRIKGATLKDYSSNQILFIEDLTCFCRENHHAIYSGRMDLARVPLEKVYPLKSRLA